MSIPLVSFDEAMAYMEMQQQGLSPEAALEEQQEALFDALQEAGERLTAVLQNRRDEIDAMSRKILQRLADENIFKAAEEHIPALEKTVTQGSESIQQLQAANGKAQIYLQRLIAENAKLQTQFAGLKDSIKNKQPLGRHQGAILQTSEAISKYVSSK